MEFSLTEIPDWAITAAIGVIGFVLLWLNRQRLGLGEVQMATKAEQQHVIDLQERRIELLETEVKGLKLRVDHLTAENEALRKLIRQAEVADV